MHAAVFPSLSSLFLTLQHGNSDEQSKSLGWEVSQHSVSGSECEKRLNNVINFLTSYWDKVWP